MPARTNRIPSRATSVEAEAANPVSRLGGSDARRADKTGSPVSVQPVEPEDAYLTGVSRSLQRRLLGLNVEGEVGQAKPHPEAAPGIHSTGSFTNPKSVQTKNESKKKT